MQNDYQLRSDTPLELIKKYAQHPTPAIRIAAAKHPNVTEELLEILFHDQDEEVKQSVLSNVKCPIKLLCQSKKGRLLLCLRNHLSNEILDMLINEDDNQVLAALSKRTDLNEQHVLRLLDTADEAIVSECLNNNAITVTIINKIADIFQGKPIPERIALLIAKHHDTDEELLNKIILHSNIKILEEVIDNHYLTARSLHLLIQSAINNNSLTLSIARRVATHPKMNKELLILLSTSVYKNTAVEEKIRIAGSKNAQIGDLLLLAVDPDQKVRYSVLKNRRSVVDIFANDDSPMIRLALTQDERCTSKILESLIMDNDTDVRCAVAGSALTPIPCLEILAADKVDAVREALAINPASPHFILEKMVSDNNKIVRIALASHPNATPALLEVLRDDKQPSVRLAAAKNPHADFQSLSALAFDFADDVRLAVANNNATTTEVLKILMYDIYVPVRIAVASNDNASDEILNLLLSDDCFGVSTSASKKQMLRKSAQEDNKATFEDCPNCGGTGGLDGRCFKCGGTGYV